MRSWNPDDTREVVFIATAAVILLVAMLLSGCAGQVNPHDVLLKQIIRYREGHQGPTHQVCAEKDWLGKCQKMDLREYDLKSAAVRKQLVDLQFICKIAGSRYKIDPDQPRFIRYTWKRECWLCEKKPVIEKAIPVTDFLFLLSAGTYCYSIKGWPKGLTQ